MSRVFNAHHIVIGTYRRHPTINLEHERELYMFLFNFMTKRGAHVYRIGGMPEHVHILCDVPPTIALSDLVQIFKTESSKVMAHNPHFPAWEGWARKFGSESMSRSAIDDCTRYIRTQKEHHKTETFEDEYRAFLRRNGLTDEAVLGDD